MMLASFYGIYADLGAEFQSVAELFLVNGIGFAIPIPSFTACPRSITDMA